MNGIEWRGATRWSLAVSRSRRGVKHAAVHWSR